MAEPPKKHRSGEVLLGIHRRLTRDIEKERNWHTLPPEEKINLLRELRSTPDGWNDMDFIGESQLRSGNYRKIRRVSRLRMLQMLGLTRVESFISRGENVAPMVLEDLGALRTMELERKRPMERHLEDLKGGLTNSLRVNPLHTDRIAEDASHLDLNRSIELELPTGDIRRLRITRRSDGFLIEPK